MPLEKRVLANQVYVRLSDIDDAALEFLQEELNCKTKARTVRFLIRDAAQQLGFPDYDY